jgi:hypothetical protein
MQKFNGKVDLAILSKPWVLRWNQKCKFFENAENAKISKSKNSDFASKIVPDLSVRTSFALMQKTWKLSNSG